MFVCVWDNGIVVCVFVCALNIGISTHNPAQSKHVWFEDTPGIDRGENLVLVRAKIVV